MEPKATDEQMSRLSEFVADAMGLHFPPARWPDLERGFARAARELGFDNTATCADSLISAPLAKHQIEILASNLTVGETYLFREPKSFQIIADQILPALIRARQDGERRLRIWSAACCTGEEAYSIAILLRRALPDDQDWNLTILATDINPHFLRKAEAGIFSQWSFRNTPAWVKDQFFTETADGQFQVLPDVKRLVRFAHLNLAADAYPSLANDTNAMDLILCRNVLIYFTPSQSQKVLQNLYRAQADAGWLLVSASELPFASASPYNAVSFRGTTLFQKDSANPSCHPADLTLPIVDEPTDQTVAESFASLTSASAPQPPAPEPQKLPDPPAPPVDPLTQAAGLYQQGFYAQAIDNLNQSLAAQPANAIALRLLARSLANQGNLAQALRACDQWIALDKLAAPAHFLRSIILQEQGASEDAAQSLRRVLFLDPDFVLAHFILGNLARDAGNLRLADKHLTRALQLTAAYLPDDVLPESEGITAARFAQIIRSLRNAEQAA